ncbi:PFS domain-containing protein [Colletotrichum plurivorum]|uniref:PFS domain-containing protein n=1 Tax=Colletotrichum plurivorum TaxID=2175906 RepID=A0A8H6K4T5_9PEZI|nr:PFS domain-containing protein [Colletotrichum plurivorum]
MTDRHSLGASNNVPGLKRVLSEANNDFDFNAATDAAKRRKSRHEGGTARLHHAEYTVGWICALSIEFAAGRSMLGEIHEDLPRAAGDTNAYVLGSIGEHNVVMACLPEGQYGTNNAAIVASHMLRSFPSICVGLMVGIGGGVPEPLDIRLGDVVVGNKVIQYDMGKLLPGGRVQRTGIPKAPPPLLLNAVAKLRALHETTTTQIPQILRNMHSRYPDMSEYAYPDCEDRLFLATYHHDGALDCSRCSRSELRQRPQRMVRDPRVFYGGIASGNKVVKSGTSRDLMAKELDILCFEMEAAGLMDGFPCIAIRGICDYADSHKNKQWQKYAAATAAAYAKELLSVLAPSCPEKDDIRATRNSRSAALAEDQQAVFARRKSLLESIGFDQIDSRHEDIKNAHYKTCEWLLQDTIYQTWLDTFRLKEHHGFFWISGKPGAGKSTIMKFAFSRAKRDARANSIIMAFFFNARGDILEKSTAGLYRSLLFQLLDEFPELQAVLDDTALIPRRQKSCPSVDVLRELLRNVISDLGPRRLTCFIDALDECDEEQVREMIVYFEDLSEEAIRSNIYLSICFSSRHYPHIDIRYGLKLVLENQFGHQQDLERYVKSHLRAGNGPFEDRVRSQILERAGGVFMWVVLVVQLLNKEFTRGRMLAVEKRMREIPSKLSELFKDILKRDDDGMEDFLLCIQWIIYAKRPLTGMEFYFAMRSGLSGSHQDMLIYDPEKDTDEAMNLLVISASRGLAEITKSSVGVVQFIHESVTDFLIKEKGLQQLWPALWPELWADFPSQSHERLKQCCLSHISLDIARSILSCNDKRFWMGHLFRTCPFLHYAVQHVFHHANTAAEGVPQDSFLENFPVKDWIYFINLLQPQQTRQYPRETTLAYILAINNSVALLECYIRHHPSVHAQGEQHGFPLPAALSQGHFTAARVLLGPAALPYSIHELFGGSLNSYSEGRPLLDWAIRNRNITFAKVMISSGHFDCDQNAQSAVHLMARAGDRAAVLIQLLIQRLLISGEDTENTNSSSVVTHSRGDCLGNGTNGLNFEKTKTLFDSRDQEGRSPLSLAADRGHEAVAQTLLQLEVDLESADTEHQRTPLSFAAEAGHVSIIRLLLEKGSAIESTDLYMNTPLVYALESRHEAAAVLLIESLIERGANPNGQLAGQSRPPPLYIAAEEGLERVVKLLLESGASATNDNSSTWVPLLAAIGAGHTSIAALLRKYGASSDGFLENADVGLYEAVCRGDRSQVALLLANGASADAAKKNGFSALHASVHLCISSDSAYIMRLLLEHGASVNRTDNFGETALHEAARCGKRIAVRVLLENGANMYLKSNSGRKALDIAVGKVHKGVVKELTKHEVDSGLENPERSVLSHDVGRDFSAAFGKD